MLNIFKRHIYHKYLYCFFIASFLSVIPASAQNTIATATSITSSSQAYVKVTITKYGVIEFEEISPVNNNIVDSYANLAAVSGIADIWTHPLARLLNIYFHLSEAPKSLNLAKFDTYLNSEEFHYKGFAPSGYRSVDQSDGTLIKPAGNELLYGEMQSYLKRLKIREDAQASLEVTSSEVLKILEYYLAGLKQGVHEYKDIYKNQFPLATQAGVFAAVNDLTVLDLLEVGAGESLVYFSHAINTGIQLLSSPPNPWLRTKRPGSHLASNSLTNASASLQLSSISLPIELPGASNAAAVGKSLTNSQPFMHGAPHLPSRIDKNDPLGRKFQGVPRLFRIKNTSGTQIPLFGFSYGNIPGAFVYQNSPYHGMALTADPIARGELILAVTDGNRICINGQTADCRDGQWLNFITENYQLTISGTNKTFTRLVAPGYGTVIAWAQEPSSKINLAALYRKPVTASAAHQALIGRALAALNADHNAYYEEVASGNLPHWGEAGFGPDMEAYAAMNQGKQNKMSAPNLYTPYFITATNASKVIGSHSAPYCAGEKYTVSHNASFDYMGPGCTTLDVTLPLNLNPERGRSSTKRQLEHTAWAEAKLKQAVVIGLNEYALHATNTHSGLWHQSAKLFNFTFKNWSNTLSQEDQILALNAVIILGGWDGKVRNDKNTIYGPLAYEFVIKAYGVTQFNALPVSARKYLSSTISDNTFYKSLTSTEGIALINSLVNLQKEFDTKFAANGLISWDQVSGIYYYGQRAAPARIGQDAQFSGGYQRINETTFELQGSSPFEVVASPAEVYFHLMGTTVSDNNGIYLQTLQEWMLTWTKFNASNGSAGLGGFVKIPLRARTSNETDDIILTLTLPVPKP